jgi:hypothetical protein
MYGQLALFFCAVVRQNTMVEGNGRVKSLTLCWPERDTGKGGGQGTSFKGKPQLPTPSTQVPLPNVSITI